MSRGQPVELPRSACVSRSLAAAMWTLGTIRASILGRPGQTTGSLERPAEGFVGDVCDEALSLARARAALREYLDRAAMEESSARIQREVPHGKSTSR